MKKTLKYITTICFFIVLIAMTVFAETYNSSNLVDVLNEKIKSIYDTDISFFPKTNENGKSANTELAIWEIETFGVMMTPLSYGGEFTDTIPIDKNCWGGKSRTAAGENLYGQVLISPYISKEDYGKIDTSYVTKNNKEKKFPNDASDYYRNPCYTWFPSSWVGFSFSRCRTNEMTSKNKFVPYYNDNLIEYYDKTFSDPDTNRMKDVFDKSDSVIDYNNMSSDLKQLLEESIQKGVDLMYGGLCQKDLCGTNYKEEIPADRTIHCDGEHPKDAKWTDYVLIAVPPTDISWGIAYRFNKDGSEYLYAEIPMAPFGLINQFDLIAEWESTTSSANEGDTVYVSVNVDSTFAQDLTGISYKWEIKDANGNTVPASYGGYGYSKSGEFDIFSRDTSSEIKGNALFDVSFTMPNTDVSIYFSVNENDKISEIEKGNNYLDSEGNPTVIKCIAYQEPKVYEDSYLSLDYNVLSKTVSHNLNGGQSIVADLGNPPIGNWCSNATGSLGIYPNDPSNMFINYKVTENPYVNESSSYITRRPVINYTLNRSSFGDNPMYRQYAQNSVISKQSSLAYSGSVSRGYVYTVYCGGEDCSGHDKYGTDTASFQRSSDILNMKAYTYNGMAVLPNAKQYDTHSNGTGTNNSLAWKGTSYDLDVVRYMCHVDDYNNPISWEAVPGQYKRTFAGQSEGSVIWTASYPMSAAYYNDRKKASDRQSGADNALFASDKSLQNLAYPIKSGYYFNPAGTYTCTVTTTQYKDNEGATPEHQELVNKIKASFRYNNDMTYANNDRNTFKFTNVSQANPMGILKITSNTNKTAEKLVAESTMNGNTNPLICEVLEGYYESGTADSYNTYKYREYVSTVDATGNSQSLYKVTETTTITFTIQAPSKTYTFVNMKNGDYNINVTCLGFSSTGLNIIPANLDGIKVTVAGSRYDDIG